MDRKNIFKTLKGYKELLELEGYTVFYVGLYGSQNYNLSDEKSDIDARAIVAPKLEDMLMKKTISKKIVTEFGEIDVKDLVTYCGVARKGNFSFIEPLQTEFYIGDKELREILGATPVNLRSVLGAMFEKQHAFTKEYPSKKEEFEKWGCDPKQLHHIYRLRSLIQEHILNGSTKSFESFVGDNREWLMEIKRNTKGLVTKDNYKASIEIVMDNAKLSLKGYEYKTLDTMPAVLDYLKKYFKKDLYKSPITYVRTERTFNGDISKKDIKMFPQLAQYKGKDIRYTIYCSLEIDA